MQKRVEKHGRDHRPPKYGTTTGGGADPTRGMLFLPSADETDGQVLSRDSGATYGLSWVNAGSSAAEWAVATLNTPITVASSDYAAGVPWDYAETTATSVFGWDSGTGRLTVEEAGAYVYWLSLLLAGGPIDPDYPRVTAALAFQKSGGTSNSVPRNYQSVDNYQINQDGSIENTGYSSASGMFFIASDHAFIPVYLQARIGAVDSLASYDINSADFLVARVCPGSTVTTIS